MIPLVLLHSPLVGPLTWRGVAPRVADAGFLPVVPDLRIAHGAQPTWRRQVRLVAAAMSGSSRGEAAWLVAHSGAGPLVPAIDRELEGAGGWVFVDATLPHPGRSRLETMPAELQARILGAARAGMAPRWTDWFESAVLERVLPDLSLRRAFIADTPQVPLEVLGEPMPEIETPPERACAYIQLSAAYAEAAAKAEAAGWTVSRMGGAADHLWPVTHPAAVADAIVTAIRQGRPGR